MDWMSLLRSCPYNRLFQIAQTLQALPTRQRIHRARLLQALERYLSQPEHPAMLLQTLPPIPRAILEALERAGGSMTLAEFARRFGPLHARPAEDLQRRGLIFPIHHAVYLPDEIRPLLRRSPPPPAPESPPPGMTLQLDLCSLLALMESQPLSLHGRWFTPSTLRSIASFLHLPFPEARREHEIPYLAFLHDLLEAAGLARSARGALSITPEAMGWLESPYPERARHLWNAWWEREPAPSRFPHALARLPRMALRMAIQDALDQWPEDARIPWGELAQAVYAHLVALLPPRQPAPEPDLLHAHLPLLLAWMGLLLPPEGECAGMTALGRWLLRGGPRPADLMEHFQPGQATMEGDPHGLRIIGDLPLALRFELRIWAEPISPTVDRLTPDRIAAAIARGRRLEDFEALWERIWGKKTDPDLRSLLQSWAMAARPWGLRAILVFEGDPKSLPPRLRSRLGPEIRPGQWIIRDPRPEPWIRALQRLGWPAREPCSLRIGPDPSTVDAAWLWLGVELGLRAARRRGRTLPPLRRLRDRLARIADPLALEGARALLEQIEGPAIASPQPSGAIQWETLLKEAVREGRPIELIYAHPSADRLTAYSVLPLRLFPPGRGRPQPILLALDLNKGEERNFRLDRILEVLPLEVGGYAPSSQSRP